MCVSAGDNLTINFEQCNLSYSKNFNIFEKKIIDSMAKNKVDLTKIKVRGNLILIKMNPVLEDNTPLKDFKLPEHVRKDYKKDNETEYYTKLKVLARGPEVSEDIQVGTILQVPGERIEFFTPILIQDEVFHLIPDNLNNVPILRLD